MNFHRGPFGSLNNVHSVGFAMFQPVGTPTLKIRNIRLTTSPEDTIFTESPLIDRYGQWIPAKWPGKARSDQQLISDWRGEERELMDSSLTATRFGGSPDQRTEATGFFRVEKIDGRYWLIDPEGYFFFSTGSCSVRPRSEFARVKGREYIFTELPPEELSSRDPLSGALSTASFYTWNLYRRFGEDWYNKWMDLTVLRMNNWGLNTFASWADSTIAGSYRKPYVAYLYGLRTGSMIMGMPDVYDPDYLGLVDSIIHHECAPRKTDPFLIGYFIGNEPIWPDREVELVDRILNDKTTFIYIELMEFLKDGDTPERRKEFVYKAYKRFLEITGNAIRKYDPNHMNLGFRFGGSAPVEIIEASKEYFDVFSINIYNIEATPEQIERIYAISDLPVIIGEFHFGTPGRGLAPGLVQTRDQKERGVAYQYYVENAASHPAVVGAHWFMWMDQPPTGRGDGENYNIGFVDVTDRPYNEMINAARDTYKRIYDVHSGKIAPVINKAKTQ